MPFPKRIGSFLPKKTPRRGSEEFPKAELLEAAREIREEEEEQKEQESKRESQQRVEARVVSDNREDENHLSSQSIQNLVTKLLEVRKQCAGTSVYLPEDDMMALNYMVRPILLGQPMLLELCAPMKICGDIHGQFHDLIQMLDKMGYPPHSNYLFLGDYVDRGLNSLETICLMMAYKVLYPENFFILRGNHETEAVNRVYGFYDECKRRYSVKLYRTFCDTFNCLPVAAVLEESVICMHGGLSPQLQTLDDIANIQRPCEVPERGIMCDLLWSDPDLDGTGWGGNERGISWVFGPDVVEEFLERHNLDLIIRGHQVVEDGYEFFANRQLVTLFSAPNYCGEFDNAGAMILADEDLTLSFQVFGSCQETLDDIVRQNSDRSNE